MSLVVYIGTEKFSNKTSAYAADIESRAFTLGDIVREKQQEETDQPAHLLIDSFTDESSHSIEYWLNQDASRQCTIAWPHPAAWLAASLQQTPRPKEALWQWSYQADLLLRLFKQHRQQLSLQGYVPGSLASDELPWVTTLNLNDIAPLYRLIAMQLVQEDSMLQQALNYLSASSTSVQRWQLPAVDVVEQALDDVSSTESERQLSGQQLEKAQQAIKIQQEEAARFNQKNKELTQQLEKAQKSNAQAEQNATNISQRLSEKNAQLLTVEQEHDSLKSTLEKEQKETAELQKQQAELQDHAHQVEQENAALLDQLMKAQETFEEAILENNRQQEDIAEQAVKLNWLRGKTKKQDEKIDQQKALLTEKTQHYDALKDESSRLGKELQEKLERSEQASQKLQQNIRNSQEEISQLHHTINAEQDEKALIFEQLQKLQEMLVAEKSNIEQSQLDVKNHQKTIDGLQKEIASSQKGTDQLQQMLTAEQQEKALIVTQLHDAQEKLMTEKSANKQFQHKIKDHQKTINGLQKEIASSQKGTDQLQQMLTAEQQEKALIVTQLHDAQEKLITEKSANEQLLHKIKDHQKTIDGLQEEIAISQKGTDQLQQLLTAEQQEKGLILTQLHDVQEQLVKTVDNAEHYQMQAESRQKTINVLKQDQQSEQHYYESIVQWLRVIGHRNAAAAYRYSRPFKRALPQQVALIKQSAFFDAVWYSEHYADVKTAGIEPAEHYLKFGAIEGRNPSDKFDTCFYLTEYSDVAISGQNPLLHYLRYGQHEERFPAKPRQQLSAPLATK
ncbi:MULTISPECIES: hypothetical protein [unclassified Halomonas]|uniref:hypothetical protein n=1 Tax=unclassified Halomonas TaxID=2609666 RepID=UPI004033CCF8